VRSRQPASLRLCALLDKPSRRQTPVTIDYLGFAIPDKFVVGFGIDCGERYRELAYVGHVPSGDESDA
jgi:hypoxanthine phosphoribosyltransferase